MNNSNIPECEWHTKDPITGEIYFIKNDVLFSKTENETKEILSLQNTGKAKEQSDTCLSAKFSPVHSGKNIQIFCGGGVACLDSDLTEDYAVIENIQPEGIVSIELICPISCLNLLFGMCTLDNLNKKNFKSFKNSSRRKVLMEINYISKNVAFYLDGELKDKSIDFKDNAIYPCICIEKKNTIVILNPKVTVSYPATQNGFFDKMLIFKCPKVKLQDKSIKDYFKQYYDYKGDLTLIGDVSNENILNEFMCCIFDFKEDLDSFVNLMPSITLIKNVLCLLSSEEQKEIEKKVVSYISISINTKNIKIHKVITPTEVIEQQKEDFKDKIARYIINHFNSIEFYNRISIDKIYQLRDRLLKEGQLDNFLSNNIPSCVSNMKASINYIHYNDSLLVVDKTSLKIIKRESNGQFDLSAIEDLSTVNPNEVKIIISDSDLKYFIEKFDWKLFLTSLPSTDKFRLVTFFFNSMEGSKRIAPNKIVLTINQGDLFFFEIQSFLNLLHLLTKEQRKLEKANKTDSEVNLKSNMNDNDNDQNQELLRELPFSIKEVTVIDDIKFEKYEEFIVNDSISFIKLISIINKICEQLFIRGKKRKQIDTLFSAYENLSSFVNYPFTKGQAISLLADKGFYVENAFTNELKLHGFDEKLPNTDEITNEEKMENYFLYNFPTNILNTPLRDYSSVIQSNYSINAKEYSPHLNPNKINGSLVDDKNCINQFNISHTKPLLVTYSKTGVCTIWNTQLGLKKLGSVNIHKGLGRIESFTEIPEVFWIKNDSQLKLKSINDIFNSKNFNTVVYKTVIKEETLVTEKKEKPVVVSQENLNNLYTMGFAMKVCQEALEKNGNNFSKALDYLLEHGTQHEEKEKEDLRNTKIGSWQCSACTFLNEKGTETCEMCETGIPDHILKKFENKSETPKQETTPITDSKVTSTSIKDSSVTEFKDIIVSKIHISINNGDPFAPFLLIALLHNFVENTIIISVYKMMVNPIIVKDFFTFGKDNLVTNNIDQRKFPTNDLGVIMKYLNDNYFDNLHTLYPSFLGASSKLMDNSYNHLIPIEHSFIKVPMNSIYDSFCIEDELETRLIVLSETQRNEVVINEYSITSQKLKYNDIASSSLTIQYKLTQNIHNFFSSNDFLTELMILGDSMYTYVLAKDSYYTFNISSNEYKFIGKKKFMNNEIIRLFRQAVPIYNDAYTLIHQIEIYDDMGKIISILINNGNSIDNAGLTQENIEEMKLNKIEEMTQMQEFDLNKFNENEISLLSEMLDFERVAIVLQPTVDYSIKGLVKSSNSNYKKIYYNEDIKKEREIVFNSPSFLILGNIELIFNLKHNKIALSSKPQNLSLQQLTNTPLSQIEFNAINDFIPLTVVDFKGAQSQQNLNVSSILFNNHRFVSNYPKPEYIFSHIHGKAMEIESIVIGSDEKPKSSDIPFGEGLIFLVQSIESISLCKLKYDKFTYEDFTKFHEKKIKQGEDFYEYDPVCYVKMSSTQMIRSTIIKNKKCKYIYFLPTCGRQEYKNFDKQVMSILFFGVEGKIDTNCDDIPSSYLPYINYTFGDKSKIKCNIKLLGKQGDHYVKLGSKEDIELSSIISNEYNAHFYSSKTAIKNEYYQDSLFDSVKINITYDDSKELFDLIGVTCEFNSFKSIDKKNDSLLLNTNMKNQFHKIIINSSEFDKFNIQFAKLVNDKNTSNEKKYAILQYLVDLIKRLPLLATKLESAIDYYNFISNNLLNNSKEELANLSFDFICTITQSNNQEVIKLIRSSFENILKNIHQVGLNFKGFINLIKLLHLINLDKSTIITQSKETIKFCLNKIEECNLQSKEHIFIKSYLKFPECPFDKYCLEHIGQSSNQTLALDNSIKTIESTSMCEIVEDSLSIIVDVKKIMKINKIKLLFTLNESMVVSNFRVNIFELDQNGVKLNLKAFKYYYDHVWKQLTKYNQSKSVNDSAINQVKISTDMLKGNNSSCNSNSSINDSKANVKDVATMFCTSDFRSLEYNFENNRFDTRFILIEISLSDGSKSSLDFPAVNVFPLVYGNETSTSTSNDIAESSKLAKLFTFISSKKSTINLLGKSFILKQANDPKKYMIDYSPSGIQVENIGLSNISSSNMSNTINTGMTTIPNQQSNEVELANQITNLENYQATVKKIIQEQMKNQETFDTEALKLKISKTIEDIKKIQTRITSLNNPIDFNDTLSLNLELILVFINECNKISSVSSEDKIDDLSFVMSMINTCLFNEIGNMQNAIIEFLKKYVFGFLSKEQNESLFNQIVKTYLDKDNEYQSIISIVNVISNLDFNLDIIFKELKGVFNQKWGEDDFKDIFFKASSLIIILMQKITKEDQILKGKEAEVIEMNLGFIDYLMKESKIQKEKNNLILFQVLNLLHVCFINLNKENRENLTSPNLIKYLIDIVFSLWNNEIVKSKILLIVDILIDPFNLINGTDVTNSHQNYSNDKVILIIQSKTLEFIRTVIDKSQSDGRVFSDEESNKFDYILNCLNKCYTINTLLSKEDNHKNEQEKLEIKANNSTIIEGFIKVVLKFNHSSKIGCSNANNFWKYLTDILERGNLEMMFYNNNFKKLIIDSFIKLDVGLQEILFSKFTKAFQTLYLKETSIKSEIYEQVIEVILHIIINYTNTKSEDFITQFVINLSEIIIYGNYGSLNPNGLMAQIKLSTDLMLKLFIGLSNYLIGHLNLISFSGSVCGNLIIYQRMSIATNLLYIASLYINDFLNQITDDQIKNEQFQTALRNYLIFLIFDSRKNKAVNPPLMIKLAKAWLYVNQIINACINRRVLIESCLIGIMKIVRKVDDCIFIGIKNGKMALKNGIKLINKLFSTLETLLNMFLIDDIITKYFAFELQGFKFFIDRVNSHRQHSVFASSTSNDNENHKIQFNLNSELLKNVNNEISIKTTTPSISPNIENDANNSNMFSGALDKYKKEEFALLGKLNLLDGNITKDPTIVSNVNWSSKKKPNPGHVYIREFKEGSYYEECFYFELKHLIELKDVLFTINSNLVSINDKIAGNILIVILECGESLDKMDICVKLDKINDQQYDEKMIIAFGFNFYSNIPDMIKQDDSYLDNLIDQLINCKARYFKFIVRRPIILSNKNTHITKLNTSLVSIGINCVSLSGVKLVNTQKVIEFIQDKEKNVSIKIISKMFTAEFIDTLKYIAQDSSIIDNIKQIYNAFEPYISSHASILSNIFINVSKYNFDLGEWLLNRLLNVDNTEIHAKLAVEITQNNPEYVNERLNKFIHFIFCSLAENSPLFFSSDSEQKIKNVGKFIKFFTLTLNGLLISPFTTQSIQLNFDFSILLSLIKHIQKYTLIRNEVLSFITILLLPNQKVNIKNASTPDNTISLLINLFEEHYIYDYLGIISILVCDSKEYETLFIQKDLVKYFCDQFLTQVHSGIRGKNMLHLMSILKNMSFSKEFVKKIREKDYDFQILDSIKNKNEKSDSILINNNISFLNNIVIFIRNCINDYPDYYTQLGSILINDLEVCKKKIDKAYANNVLMPLLGIEKASNVCIQPLDSILKIIYSSYCNFTNDYSSSSSNKDTNHEEIQSNYSSLLSSNSKSILQGNNNSKSDTSFISNIWPNTVDIVVKNLFTKFMNSKYPNHNINSKLSQKTSQLNWKHIASSKAKNDIKFDSLFAQGGYLFVFNYPQKKMRTLFYIDASSLSVNQNIINIPFTEKNFIIQIDEDCKYIQGAFSSSSTSLYSQYSNDQITINSNFDVNIMNMFKFNLKAEKNSTEMVFTKTMITETNQLFLYTKHYIEGYDIFYLNIDDEFKEEVIKDEKTTIHKISPINYIDESGNLSLGLIKKCKYYKENHPLFSIRNNPIFEFPSNIKIKNIKSLILCEKIELRDLKTGKLLDDELELEQVIKEDNRNIIDVYYDIQSLRGVVPTNDDINSIISYEPVLPVLKAFENLGGIMKIVSVLQNSIKKWKNKEIINFWLQWIDDVKKFSELPSFFSSLIRHQKCFNIIFNLLCGLYDNSASPKEIGVEASKYIYEILDNSFIESKSSHLRQIAIDKGIFKSILDRLQLLTLEKPRKYLPGEEKETKENKKDEKEIPKVETKTKGKKGVGYGSDQTGDNEVWDVNSYLEGRRANSLQIASIIKLLTNFFDSKEMKMESKLMNEFLTSPILPCLESAYRGGTLLELAKDDQLYYAYLIMTLKLSQNPSLISLLLDISKDYKPVQTQSVYTLLSLLHDGAKIFKTCLKNGQNTTKTVEEKLAIEIINTYEEVTKNIKSYQTHLDIGKNYLEILKLPMEKSYPLLLRELSFDYMSMRNNGPMVHYYSSNLSGEASATKMIRLAQEYADLSRSLPCESTNSIYVRVDKNNMDFIKILIMGSEGTPYSNGAFEYDVYFDSQYPNSPPKVNLMTTGGGTTRFNPNLYQNGKVCLSLLGTWRGKSTENWDPKISTLLQVLISIQSIIMSDLVYFNEPSCEGEMGKPEGEAKNEAYSNIVRYANIKYAIIDKINNPSKGFEEVIRRHFYLKKEQILKEVQGWIERSKTVEAKYTSFSYDHNSTWANKMNQPKAYTKMMEEIYVELEKVLNALPMPSDLLKKTEDEKIANEKKVEKMEFVSLDNVDVTYDTNIVKKEINLNDDAVKDRWSRYIGAMGIDAVQRQANANVFLSGASGLGIEIAKNIVLSGCKKFVLHDTKKTTYFDLSSQFFLGEEDIGYNRAEASLKKLQQLNYYVKILSSTQPLPLKDKDLDSFGMKDFSIVILTECDYNTMITIDYYCRKRNIAFIAVDVHGPFARLINDFGDKFAINDKDGEELKEVMIKSISNEEHGIVTVLDGTRHEYSDGDEIVIIEVEGMEGNAKEKTIESKAFDKGINGQVFKIKVLSPQQFTIGNTTHYSAYIRNGIAKQIKSKIEMAFVPVEKCLDKKNKVIDDNMLNADFSKINHAQAIQIGFEVIDKYLVDKKSLHSPWNLSEAEDIMKILTSNQNDSIDDDAKKIIYYIIFTYLVQFAPLCAYMGGIAAQEAIKAITGKFTPIHQVMYYDTIEVLPEINIKTLDQNIKEIGYTPDNKRTDGLKAIIGKKTLNSISQMKILIVGAGAIGCEILKNYAMLNVGTVDKGAIYITDPDIIEVSNLNRQFLFREKHLRLPKSSTAAASVIQMNKAMKNHIFAKLDKVCEETEGIFTDNFFLSLDAVTNALDNINARRYVDSRCVSNRIPLLESGTLGPKGHVQVILPFKTESYSSQNDPEVSNDIPQCTLKMFPEEAIHCVEWARDQFGKLFTQLPKIVMKTIEEQGDGSEMKVIKKTIKYLANAPKTFDDCLKMAREKFNKAFCNNIKQLMYAYPLDKKDKNGKLFWSLPKRPPVVVEYSVTDDLCCNFIGAYACLFANQFGIKIPYDNPRSMDNKKEMAKKATEFKVEEFKPNELKAKEIEKEVEKENKKEIEEEKTIEKEIEEGEKKTEKGSEQDDQNRSKQIKDLCLKHSKSKYKSEEFEKDNDQNFHIDLIYSMSALRCRNYKLEEMDWMKVKIKAGRIIPALATTTASIAALQSIELVKIAKEDNIDNYRNSFLNLAISYLQSAEPGPCKKVVLREGLTTNLWDRWEISLPGDKQNLKALFEILKIKYWLYPRDCFKGKKAIYSMAAYSDKKDLSDEIMNKDLIKLLGISQEEKYIDLLVTFTKDEKSNDYIKEIPKIRVHLLK